LIRSLEERILRPLKGRESDKSSSTIRRIMKVTKGIGVLTVDAYLRYRNVSKLLAPYMVLDAGAATGSKLSLYREDIKCTSCDLRVGQGVDVVSDVRFLPFKSKCFDTAAAVDVLEHLPEKFRNIAIKELIRVAKKKVVIHMPLQDNVYFKGREYDILFSNLYRRIKKRQNTVTEEHLSHHYWSPSYLTEQNFKLTGTCNTKVWMTHMTISYGFPFPLGLWLAWMVYVLFLKWLDNRPPFWGTLAYLNL
jgi:hypothetical protein